MSKSKNSKISNIAIGVFLVLLIIPQTRQPIQVFLQKGLAMISPSEIDEDEREKLERYDSWHLLDSEGRTFDFKQAQGKVVFINFWATWCPPCIAEMPSINSLYKDYNDKVVFLLVSNESPETITNFKNKNDFSFDFYKSISQVPEQLQSRSIPQTYLLDKDGAIVMDKNGAANWNSESVRDLIDGLLTSEQNNK
ncbi:TlpA family protein disulfide reductase [Bizionia sp. KMM 8389]